MCVCVCVFVSETRCSLIIIFFPPRFSFFWASNGRLFSFLFSRKRLCWRTASSLSLSFIAVRSRWPSRHAVVGFLFSLFIFVALLPLFVSPFSAGTCRKPEHARKRIGKKNKCHNRDSLFFLPLFFRYCRCRCCCCCCFPPPFHCVCERESCWSHSLSILYHTTTTTIASPPCSGWKTSRIICPITLLPLHRRVIRWIGALFLSTPFFSHSMRGCAYRRCFSSLLTWNWTVWRRQNGFSSSSFLLLLLLLSHRLGLQHTLHQL